MSNLRRLDSSEAPYVQSVIDRLEDLLAQAKRGEIAEIYAVVEFNGERTFQVVSSKPHDRLMAMGKLEAIKMEVWNAP
jgi:hypothetical protein